MRSNGCWVHHIWKIEMTDSLVSNAVANQKWYNFSRSKGFYLLGLLVAFIAFAQFNSHPSEKLKGDLKGVNSYVRCAGSLIQQDVSEKYCREYFDQYIPNRISGTQNLPKIIPLNDIGATFNAAQKAFVQRGYKPLQKLELSTSNKLQVLKSGKTIPAS